MKIEWVSTNEIAGNSIDIAAYGEPPEPVVRLAAVDQVIAEAVWAMEQVIMELPHVSVSKTVRDRKYRAQAFLGSDLVVQWRERQEGKS